MLSARVPFVEKKQKDRLNSLPALSKEEVSKRKQEQEQEQTLNSMLLSGYICIASMIREVVTLVLPIVSYNSRCIVNYYIS